MAKLISAGRQPVGIVAALLLWVALLDALFQTIPYRISYIGTMFSGGFFTFWLAITPLYAVALWLIARFVRRFPRPGGSGSWRSSWWRLGLALGGILGPYMVALNVPNAVISLGALASLAWPRDATYNAGAIMITLLTIVGYLWALSLPLVAGAVGIVGGYASGKLRATIAAGLLAGAVMMAVETATALLVLVVSKVLTGTSEGLGFMFGSPYIQSGLVFEWFFAAIVWPISLIAGSMLSLRASLPAGRSNHIQGPQAPTVAAPVQRTERRSSFILLALLLLAFGLLICLCFLVGQPVPTIFSVNIQALLASGNIQALLVDLNTLYGLSLVSFLLSWTLAVLAILTAISVTLRRPATVRSSHPLHNPAAAAP
ncbi:MAG: hypothetical protein ACLQUY_10785 [Ktedonobacterales bacterium]